MRRITGAGPTSSLRSSASVLVWMCCSGVDALEMAVQGVVGAMPEVMRSCARVSNSRPGM